MYIIAIAIKLKNETSSLREMLSSPCLLLSVATVLAHQVMQYCGTVILSLHAGMVT